MGNCLKKQLQDPNKPVAILHPPTIDTEKHSKHESRRRSPPLGNRKSSTAISSNTHIVARERGNSRKRGNQQTSRNSHSGKNENKKEVLHAYRIHCFGYTVLNAATQKFNRKNMLGQGGFGDVYKGFLSYCSLTASKPDAGFPVAVKILRRKDRQGQEEWENEMRVLSKLNHPNIVRLIGYCCEGEHRILVYECMPRGSLEDHLLKDDKRMLNWRTRLNIAVGLAKSLAYIHTREKPIIHRDLKASNILLDTNFNPKLSDFGLARFGPEGDNNHVSTRVLGTRGYFAPEYIGTGHLTVKVDVYCYGVVLLQILSGSSAVKKYTDGTTENLVQWAEPRFSQLRMECLIDEALGNNFPMDQACRFAGLTQQCLHLNPQRRPTMAEVVAELEQLQRHVGQSYETITTLSSSPPLCSRKRLQSRGF